MTLLLTSNGLKEKVAEVFPTLLKKPLQGNKVAFVTTAAYGEDDDASWLEKYRQELRNQGITDIQDVDLRGFNEEQLTQLLADTDIVFVNGGNTFFLLYYVRQSGFDRALQKFLAEDKLYVGVSAGSIICCPTIETADYDLGGGYPADKNVVGLTDWTGMNLVPFLISPHTTKENREYVKRLAEGSKRPVMALTDTQALLVRDGNSNIVGE